MRAEAITACSWNQLVLCSDEPVLVEFWASWCGPCKMVSSVMDEIATEYLGIIKCFKIDTSDYPQVADSYGIGQIPTVLLFKNGEQYLKEHKDTGMGGLFEEVQSMLTRGKLDVPLTLCGAVSRGDDLILELLLKRGLDPNESDSRDHSALHAAASKGNVKAAQLLLDYGADPNHIDLRGSVPLWEAILGEHDAIIKLLLENGAKLSSGDTGLFARIAVEQNNLELLEGIVRYGADVTLPGSDGNTALHLAVSEGH